MMVEVKLIGVSKSNISATYKVFLDGQPNVHDLLKHLNSNKNSVIDEKVFIGENIEHNYAVLLNGRSISTLPNGIKTLLRDHDRLMVTVVLGGG